MPHPRPEDSPMLVSFRRLAASHAATFRAQHSNVHNLLAGRHNYSSGTYREAILRSFFRSVLPAAASVDTGFVFGFEQVPNSRQIDILIWDSARHATVFRAGDFVIIPPESVIAAISVKSTLSSSSLAEGIENLGSLAPLDLAFRAPGDTAFKPDIRPIYKAVVAFDSDTSVETLLAAASRTCSDAIAGHETHRRLLREALVAFDPVRPTEAHLNLATRILPSLVAVIAESEVSFIRGWGPPSDRLATETFGPSLRRLPYLYAQRCKLTSPLEKLVYHVLSATYTALGTVGWSLVSAWGEIDPMLGYRFTDTDEIDESRSARLVDPARFEDIAA